MLGEMKKDTQLTLECCYGPRNVTVEVRCDDPFNSYVSSQWNITDNGCWSKYRYFQSAGATEMAQVEIRTSLGSQSTLENKSDIPKWPCSHTQCNI